MEIMAKEIVNSEFLEILNILSFQVFAFFYMYPLIYTKTNFSFLSFSQKRKIIFHLERKRENILFGYYKYKYW